MRFVSEKIELPKGPYKRCLYPGEKEPTENDRYRFDKELIGRCVCLGPVSDSEWLYSFTMDEISITRQTGTAHTIPYEENETLYAKIIANNYTKMFVVVEA